MDRGGSAWVIEGSCGMRFTRRRSIEAVAEWNTEQRRGSGGTEKVFQHTTAKLKLYPTESSELVNRILNIKRG